MSFAFHCLQVVKLINDEEDWPYMVSKWKDFFFVSYEVSAASA